MLRKSKRLLDRSASDSLENDDPGGGVMENTPFIDAGSAGPIIVDPSAAMIPVDIVMEEKEQEMLLLQRLILWRRR